MPQDLITLKRVAHELNSTITGAKVNKVLQPNAFEIDIALYQKSVFRLILNTHAKFARVSLSNAEKKNPEVAPNFCMLLRKHLSGAEVTSVTIENDDRIICVAFENLNDFKESVSIKLYAEIMGKYSNLFLVKDKKILGMLRTIPQGLDGKRVTLVGAPYKFPDKSDKISIFSPTAKDRFLSFLGEFNSQFLTANFYDFAPVTAGEIASLILNGLNGNYDGEKAYEIALSFANSKTSPTVINDGVKTDFYFTNYLSVSGEKQAYNSIITAMESVYSLAEESSETATAKSGLLAHVNAQEKKVSKKIATLSDRILSSSDLEKYKLYGELITAYCYMIKKGQTEAVLSNYTDNGEEQVKVLLDENLTPQQNAQKYFKSYRKKKSTLSQSQIQLDDANKELNYLSSIKFSINNASEKSDFEEIKEELILLGLIKSQKGRGKNKKDRPLGFIKYSIEGFNVLVGKNNLQNDRLLSSCDRGDIWFHVKSYHSSHLVIVTNGKPVPNSVITTCAEICAYYSEVGEGAKVEVDFTLRKFVKKQGGLNLGGVYYTDQQTALVTPNAHLELKI
ncbi:MAG: NFACT family protein [Clostridia bacterium]|nr:NFACT family protein [Clostridia bacterium]